MICGSTSVARDRNGLMRGVHMKIYIATHKDFVSEVPEIYEPILVGSDINQSSSPIKKDNIGDNISSKNPYYCELTALYWMWKNETADIQGLVHYRRFFSGIDVRGSLFGLLTKSEILHYLENHDVILIRPYQFKERSVGEQYKAFHLDKDLQAMKQLINTRCPDYSAAFEQVMQGNKLIRYNMFVARKPLVQDYCSWLFPLLFELEESIDPASYDNYQKRVFGFLAERLFTVWLMKNKPKTKYLPVRNIGRRGRSYSLRLWLAAVLRRIAA